MRTRTLPAERKAPRLNISRILVPSDFSPASDNAFNYALRLAEEFGAELILIHVLEPALSPSFAAIPGAAVFSEAEFELAESNLHEWIDSAKERDVAATLTMRSGLATHEIVEAAKEHDVDLIVIATHGRTGWKHFCIGSTAERVVRAAPCPVLVVREKEHEFV
jgi:universal stress protein A